MADPLLDLINGGASASQGVQPDQARTVGGIQFSDMSPGEAAQWAATPHTTVNVRGLPSGAAPDQDPLLSLVGATQQSALTQSAAQQPVAPAPISRIDKLVQGIRDPVDGGAQLLTHLLPDSIVQAGNSANNWLADKTGLVAKIPAGGVDQMTAQAEQQYQARRAAAGETGIDGWRLTGNVVSPANLAIAARAPAVASLAGRVGAGMLSGAASGALSPVTDGGGDFWSQKGMQAGIGAISGGAVPMVAGAMGRVISPNASTNPALQLLKSEGVRPTVGQTLGGAWNGLEEKLQSAPIIGDAISAARRSALKDFNTAAINRASGEVGANVDTIGQDGVRAAGDAISSAYDSALGKITGVRLDGQFNNSLLQLRGMAQGLTQSMRDKFNGTINETLMRKVSRNGSILPADYKAIDSELGNMASRYGKSNVASEQELGDAVTQLQSLLKQQMIRSNPQVASELQAADSAWANLVRVEKASTLAQNAGGVFTPGQLNSAIRMSDDSVRKRAVSRGTALMQDLGNAGQSILGNKVPDSGTAQRLMYGASALGAGYMVNPLIPAGVIGGAAAYTSPAQSLLRAAFSSRPGFAKPAADAFRQITPVLGPAGAQFGLGFLNNQNP